MSGRKRSQPKKQRVNRHRSHQGMPRTPRANTAAEKSFAQQYQALPAPDYRHFWRGFLLGVETMPRDITSVRGASGIQHPVVACGVDDDRSRVVLVSAEGDARSAALAQADIQAGLGDVRVLMARTVLLDLGAIAQMISEATGATYVSNEHVGNMPDDDKQREELMRPYAERFTPVLIQWLRNAQGVKNISLRYGLSQILDQVERLRLVRDTDGTGPSRLDLTGLLDGSAQRSDHEVGICPIALHDFSEDDMETINAGRDIDAIATILQNRNILQFFFPAADQLMLGLVERQAVPASELLNRVNAAPDLGHPFGPQELTAHSASNLSEIIEELQDLKLAVDGELGVEITSQGQEIRAQVRFQPRDSLIARIANRFNFNINLNP